VHQVLTGENFHSALTALAWRHISAGMPAGQIVEHLRGIMLSIPGRKDGLEFVVVASLTAHLALSQVATVTRYKCLIFLVTCCNPVQQEFGLIFRLSD
jgi:hypothetical protein